MRFAALAFVIAVGTAGSAFANPLWLQHPQREDIQREFPRAARSARETGQAEITCKLTAEYRLEACEVSSEEPAGLGFGEAALRLAPKFKMRKTVNGKPVLPGTIVTAPIPFALD